MERSVFREPGMDKDSKGSPLACGGVLGGAEGPEATGFPSLASSAVGNALKTKEV